MRNLFLKYSIYWILGLLFIFLLVILFLSEGFHGGADNITHYRYSRYSWIHPEWLLWHWGKPVFTLVTSPFAQFGFIGVQIFNICVSILTCYFGYQVAKMLNIKTAWLYPVFLVFSPIYTLMAFSGMTEILFGFFSIFFAWLFLKKKYKWASSFYSFAPLVRTEGIILMPVYIVATLWKRKYAALPFFMLGFILYSIIGYFYYDDILWLINKLPYGTEKPYGVGSFWHYFGKFPAMTGYILAILTLLGIFKLLSDAFRKKPKSNEASILLFLPFLAYFLGHIVMWWSGIGNSDGNIRYMASIMTLTSILALIGFNLITDQLINLPHQKIIKPIVGFIVVGFILLQPFTMYNIPIPNSTSEKCVYQCTKWLKTTDYLDKKFYYLDPYFVYLLNFDPFDPEISRAGLYNYEKPYLHIEEGSIVIYDMVFWPRRIPLKELINSPYFELIKTFIPLTNNEDQKPQPYLYLFKKIAVDSD